MLILNEKQVYRKQKQEIIRIYQTEIRKLEKRIKFLEGKEFYEGIKKDVLAQFTKKGADENTKKH